MKWACTLEVPAVRRPCARNTTPNPAPYTTGSCFAPSRHSARDYYINKRTDHRMTSYNRALEIARCESIETTLRTRRPSWGGHAHSNERRAAAKANRVRKPWACSAERTGWEGERVDRLRTERHPGVWHNGGLESDGIEGWVRCGLMRSRRVDGDSWPRGGKQS